MFKACPIICRGSQAMKTLQNISCLMFFGICVFTPPGDLVSEHFIMSLMPICLVQASLVLQFESLIFRSRRNVSAAALEMALT